MPANTPRGYPYSLPADSPADVPAAMQGLAEAIDQDVEDVANTVAPRAMFRMSGFSPVSFPTFVAGTYEYFLPMEVNDTTIGGAVSVLQGSETRIYPRLPGFWLFRAEMVVPVVGGSLMERVGIYLYKNINFFAVSGTSSGPVALDGFTVLSVEAGMYFNGTTDYLRLRGSATQNVAFLNGPDMVIRERSLFGMRMTES